MLGDFSLKCLVLKGEKEVEKKNPKRTSAKIIGNFQEFFWKDPIKGNGWWEYLLIVVLVSLQQVNSEKVESVLDNKNPHRSRLKTMGGLLFISRMETLQKWP